MSRLLWFVAAVILAATSGSPAAATDNTMSCKGRIVKVGDAAYRVRTLCGDPDFTQQRVEQRGAGNRFGARSVELVIEEWVYDFGPSRFVQYLTFEGGRLIAIRAGEYGTKSR